MNHADIFQRLTLTAAINDVTYKPNLLGDMGLFHEEGITTTSVLVERQGSSLALVPAKERGAPGTPISGDKRTGVTFGAVHLPTTGSVNADEAQGVREFGSEDGAQGLQNVVNQRLEKMKNFLDVTLEYQRIGAVKGQVLDADGTTVLANLFGAFDMTQKTKSMALGTGTTKVQVKCLEVLELIEEALDGVVFDGVHVLCGKTFWSNLVSHDKVEETYLYQQSVQAQNKLQGDLREVLNFGGMTFERYRGGVGGTPFVPAGEAFALPMGVPEMFITRFAPANYNDAVNTRGLPFYASAEEMPHGKGWELEAQTNPITLNTRPSAVIKLT